MRGESSRDTPPPRRLSRRQFLALGAAAAAVGVPYTMHSNTLQVVRTRLPGGSAGGGSVRVAQFTDLHAPHNWMDDDRLIDEVRRFDPHLLVVTGDAVDRLGNEGLVRLYGRMPARVAKYACLGNWEYQGHCDLGLLRRAYEHAGVRLLVNERAAIEIEGQPFDIVAIDDWYRGRPRFSLLDGEPSRDGEHTLLLAHCPAAFDALSFYPGRRITTLSGHTHGGQIAPMGLALITPIGSGHYIAGWYEGTTPGHHLYVSRGLGHTAVPFRLGARPELTLLTI
ncbi:MAG: metallophosphoesterase [Gemmatimonadaceae bacterium]